MTTLDRPPTRVSLESILETARRRIEVSEEELAEARKRRDALAGVLRKAFGPDSRTYVNGSIAHGDALTPLTDVDLGVVVPDPNRLYGPGLRGPGELKEIAAAAIRTLKDQYPKLVVELKDHSGGPRRRSILVRFGDPVTPGQADFTADVLVTIDNRGQSGLYIPNYDQWDRSDPEQHTRLVVDANTATKSTFARTVRLVKHWNRTNQKPLCSWNIKALALGSITKNGPLVNALEIWFRHAITSLTISLTPDPAGVAGPINLNDEKSIVLRRLRYAAEQLQLAKQFEAEGYLILAQERLARIFNDEAMLPHPSASALMDEEAKRLRAQTSAAAATGSAAVITGTGAGASRPRQNLRSWGE